MEILTTEYVITDGSQLLIIISYGSLSINAVLVIEYVWTRRSDAYPSCSIKKSYLSIINLYS